jgi:hypothetical protein
MPTHTFKQNKPSLGIGRTIKEIMNSERFHDDGGSEDR